MVRRGWIFVGVVLLGGGLAGAMWEDPHHNACTAGLGSFGSLSGDVARNCGFHNTMFLVAIAAAFFGLAVMVAALLFRS